MGNADVLEVIWVLSALVALGAAVVEVRTARDDLRNLRIKQADGVNLMIVRGDLRRGAFRIPLALLFLVTGVWAATSANVRSPLGTFIEVAIVVTCVAFAIDSVLAGLDRKRLDALA